MGLRTTMGGSVIVYLLLATAALNQVSTPACSCVRAFSSHSGISLHSLGSNALTPFPPSRYRIAASAASDLARNLSPSSRVDPTLTYFLRFSLHTNRFDVLQRSIHLILQAPTSSASDTSHLSIGIPQPGSHTVSNSDPPKPRTLPRPTPDHPTPPRASLRSNSLTLTNHRLTRVPLLRCSALTPTHAPTPGSPFRPSACVSFTNHSTKSQSEPRSTAGPLSSLLLLLAFDSLPFQE
ncbi:hypothetical protein A1Q2_02739 [Trichosporon asahii var. asahii CBS 8904]|uniref:Uncharacterized protein n=1 Tax=Trichosporon asahii var. asahii (strain CBS 8904) TaxID=1220162 RepID=K1W1Z5_TRIAC|nr:hypothetical protein A1Q2_02739 [Trichosporon asahii var. asahii CBS 8904]